MEIPSGLKPGLWGAAAGAVAMAIVGFQYLDWTTKTSADKFAQESADTAVISALVPFCIIKAKADPDAAAMTKFQAEQSSWSRGDIVLKAGWASLDGKTSGNDQLARACADKLLLAKAG